MAIKTQTDNKFLGTKLLLRRHFLEKYHRGGASVFDACCGDQKIWSTLRRDYKVSYFGADWKKTKLRVNSARLCEDPAYAQFDIVDIDTYGSPWAHFFNLLPNVKKPITIFLTVGKRGAFSRMRLPQVVCEVIGLGGIKNIPIAILQNINAEHGTDYALLHAQDFDLVYEEIKEAFPCTNARHLGLRLKPRIDKS